MQEASLSWEGGGGGFNFEGTYLMEKAAKNVLMYTAKVDWLRETIQPSVL